MHRTTTYLTSKHPAAARRPRAPRGFGRRAFLTGAGAWAGAAGIAVLATGMVLVIVSRNRPDLYAWIRRVFFTDTRFQLIFDLRRVVRRRIKGGPVFERRQRDRPARAEIEQLRIRGWVALPSALEERSASKSSDGGSRDLR